MNQTPEFQDNEIRQEIFVLLDQIGTPEALQLQERWARQ